MSATQKEEKGNPNYPKIDEVTEERKTYRDSDIFTYEGQNYGYNKIVDICKEFINNYKRFNSKEYHYFEEISQMMANHTFTLVIDYNDICNAHVMDENTCHSNFLHHLLEDSPKLFLKSFRRAAHEIMQQIHFDYSNEIITVFKVVVANATMFRKEITEINHSDVGKLIYTENFVISISEQKDYTKRMAWICGECGKMNYRDSIGFQLARLRKCMFCDSDDIIPSNKDAITDTMQEIKIQQRFERMEAGIVPKAMYGYVIGKDMINLVTAGDIGAITAVVDIQRNPAPSENAIADYYLDILWVEKIPDDYLIEDDPELEEKVKTFIDPKDEDKGYESLVNSIAPSVMGHEIIKEALLLQLCGSDTAWFRDNSRHRGECNILLVGDAGTAKTKLAYYVHQLYARAVYVAGKVTEAGMTASVDLAQKGGHAVLTAGAYLLASSEAGGIAICDEMEKTEIKAKDATAACLDDRQMVEIHKHTIHQSIQINCASLHIANPKTGEAWNPELSIKENTGFENWYLTRFCTWVVRDIVDKELDTAKAKHYLGQFGDTIRQNELKDTTLNELRRKQALTYLSNLDIKTVPEMRMFYKYSRKHFHPHLDPKSKASRKLEQFYISVRPMTGNTKGFRISMRNLGDLVRFSEASARAHFRNEVTEKDADVAIKLVSSSIASSGFNMFTGKYETVEDGGKGGKKLEGDAPVGFFTAEELLHNKTAREIISDDLVKLANKRQNRFYREISNKMKKVVKVIKLYALMKCRDCGGDGFRREGGMHNVCYNCKGHGGFSQSFDLSELNYQLLNAGLTNNDIQDLVTHLIKKKVILPLFNDTNTYKLQKDYKNALLELRAIEAQIELVMDVEHDKNIKNKELLVKSPEMQNKISKISNLMSPQLRDNVKKMLEEEKDKEKEDES